MATDVILDDANDTVFLAGAVVKAATRDFLLDSPERHTGRGKIRRALVHDFQDGLTINWNGDYPGGVTINGTIITLNTFTPDNPNAAGDVSFTFWHPDEVTETGGTPGFNETVFLGALLSTVRDDISTLKNQVDSLTDEISSLKDRVAKLESSQ